MYCKNCGSQIDDNAVACPNCGAATDKLAVQQNQQVSQTNNTLKLIAKIFIIIGMVCGCWIILPLIFGALGLSALGKGKGKPSVGMSVCVLLFCSLIGGILMLCIKDENNTL